MGGTPAPRPCDGRAARGWHRPAKGHGGCWRRAAAADSESWRERDLVLRLMDARKQSRGPVPADAWEAVPAPRSSHSVILGGAGNRGVLCAAHLPAPACGWLAAGYEASAAPACVFSKGGWVRGQVGTACLRQRSPAGGGAARVHACSACSGAAVHAASGWLSWPKRALAGRVAGTHLCMFLWAAES